MEQLTDQDLLGWYQDTLNKCGLFLLNEADEVIEYNIYEDFDVDVHSFLHINSLQRLYDKDLINAEELQKSLLLRNKVLELQNTDGWGLENFRTSEKWREIMTLADEIKNLGK